MKILGRYLWVLLIAPIVFCLYISILFSHIRAGEQFENSSVKLLLLDSANSISFWGFPDLYVANAEYNMIMSALSLNQEDRKIYLDISKKNWMEAHSFRPSWPYYMVGAFNADINMGVSDKALQDRFDSIVKIAPNERGIDRPMFELGFAVWRRLRRDQQDWLISRVASSAITKTIIFAIENAEKNGIKPLICAKLPWPIAKKHCLKGKMYRSSDTPIQGGA